MLDALLSTILEILFWFAIYLLLFPLAWIVMTPWIFGRAFFPSPYANGYWKKISHGYSGVTFSVGQFVGA